VQSRLSLDVEIVVKRLVLALNRINPLEPCKSSLKMRIQTRALVKTLLLQRGL